MHARCRSARPHLVASKCTLIALCVFAAQALSQAVVVDLGKLVNVLTVDSIGFDANMYSGDAFAVPGAAYLRTAGVTAPRYPGNHGWRTCITGRQRA